MISDHLASLLAPYKHVVNRHALSHIFRVLELSENLVTGWCTFGNLTTKVSLPGLDQTVYVNGATFLAVLASLPKSQEVTFQLKSNMLHWTCGSASGQLETSEVSGFPKLASSMNGHAWTPTTDFRDILELGAISCGTELFATTGLYGVQVDMRGENVAVASCDDATIAVAMNKTGKPQQSPELATFSTSSLKLLGAIANSSGSSLWLSEDALVYQDDVYEAMIKQIAPLAKDYRELYTPFIDGESVIELPKAALASFLKRATALAENSKYVNVTLKVSHGQIKFGFAEGNSASEEYHLVDGLEIPGEEMQIELDGLRVARALSHVDSVILDHMERGALVFKGSDPEFYYIIAGK